MPLAIKEVGFGNDKMGKPLMYSNIDSLGQALYNIFVMVPGSLPSLPRVGVNIKKYMPRLEGHVNTEQRRDDIFYSCSELLTFIKVSDVHIQEVEQANGLTLVVLVKCRLEDEDYALVSALKTGNQDEVVYSFRAEVIKAA